MFQVVYVSTRRGEISARQIADILASARPRNTALGVTGMLYADDRRFLQAVEGSQAAVDEIMSRIRNDNRHMAIVELSRRAVDQREFGDWSMASREPGEAAAPFLARVARLVHGAAPTVRATIEGFAALRNT